MRAPLVVAVAVLPGVAGAHVVLPGTQPGEVGGFAASSSCAPCHAGYDPDGDYEASDGYAGASMAWAAADPLFRAALAAAEIDSPGIGDFCLRCHAPSAFLEGRAALPDGSLLLETDRGVECSFCHRLIDGAPEGPFAGNGMFFADDGAVYRAGIADALDTGHAVGESGYVGSSLACGVCHEQSSVLHGMRDPEGDVIYPQFPVDRTYSEWLASDFAAEGTGCVDCHMPEEDGRAASDADAPERTVHRHEWNAADVLLADLLPRLDPELPPEVVDALEAGRERARESLRAAASLELRTARVRAGGEAEVLVRITNRAGHKLPTGFADGRRMWLDVRIADSSGDELLRSGRYDEASGEIEIDRYVNVYQARHGVAFFGPSFRSALNDMVAEDSRIPPRGFAPEEGRIDLIPFGRVFGVGEAEVHQDDANYGLDLGCDVEGPLRVTAALFYQRVTPAFVDHLRAASDAGEALGAAFDATGRGAPEEMTRLEADVEVEACPEGDDGDDEWDGIGPAVRRDAGPPPPNGDVPDPAPRPGRLPGGGGCSCGAASGAPALALAVMPLLLRRRSHSTRR